MEIPESQRLIAVSLGKIAASRGQKGGINLHKNLLVATVLHKARTAYMIQHLAKQRAAQTSPTTTTTTESVEMRDQSNNVSQPSSSSSSPSPAASVTVVAAAPTFPTAPPSAAPHSASVAPAPETGSSPDSAVADVSLVQVAECDDKENTPPPPPPSSGDATTSSDCEKRLQGDNKGSDTVKDSKDKHASPSARTPMSHAQPKRDYVSSQTCSSCVLKRRRTLDRVNENVSAPKVRILESRGSQDSGPEPMQCDSPQISNLVNIFNTSFAGLSGAAAGAGGGDGSVRSVGPSILSSVASHKMPENMTCAKEMKVGLDSVHQPLVLSV